MLLWLASLPRKSHHRLRVLGLQVCYHICAAVRVSAGAHLQSKHFTHGAISPASVCLYVLRLGGGPHSATLAGLKLYFSCTSFLSVVIIQLSRTNFHVRERCANQDGPFPIHILGLCHLPPRRLNMPGPITASCNNSQGLTRQVRPQAKGSLSASLLQALQAFCGAW